MIRVLDASQASTGQWVLTASDARGTLLEEFLARPSAVMARGQVLKHDRTATVVVVGKGDRRWVVKRYNTKDAWHAIRRQARASRAVNCWKAAAWLAQAGIDTPARVAVLEERRGAVLRGRAYWVCEFVPGKTLAEVLAGGGGTKRLVAQACGIVRRLHDAGIVHGDLKTTNFIVSGERMVLADLDATRRARHGPAPAGDVERFLRNWQHQPELLALFEQHLAGLPRARNPSARHHR